MARGQNPKFRTPSEHPDPTTKIGSNMGGEFTYPKMVPLVLTHDHTVWGGSRGDYFGSVSGGYQSQNMGWFPFNLPFRG